MFVVGDMLVMFVRDTTSYVTAAPSEDADPYSVMLPLLPAFTWPPPEYDGAVTVTGGVAGHHCCARPLESPMKPATTFLADPDGPHRSSSTNLDEPDGLYTGCPEKHTEVSNTKSKTMLFISIPYSTCRYRVPAGSEAPTAIGAVPHVMRALNAAFSPAGVTA